MMKIWSMVGRPWLLSVFVRSQIDRKHRAQSTNFALQKKEQAAANAESGQKKKKVTAAQLRVQKGMADACPTSCDVSLLCD